MKPSTLLLIAGGLFTVAASWWVGLGSDLGPVIIMTLGFVAAFTAIAHLLATTVDNDWFPKVVTIGYLIKVGGATLRFYVVEYVYDGFGDAIGYHAMGTQFAEVWRSLEVPQAVGFSAGTRFVQVVTGLLYAPHRPHMLGGFIIFATISFVGVLFFYLAFRRSFAPDRLKVYAWLLFLLPALSFWPSSIGKDALMVLFLGAGVYGASRLFEGFRFRWIVLIGLAAWGAGAIRAHVAALLLGAILVSATVARGPRTLAGNVRRLILVGVLVFGAFVTTQRVADIFRFDLERADLDPVVADIERRTGQGGSELGGDAVSSIADVPGAFVRVMFAPLPHQAHNLQALIAAAETTFLLGLFVKESPWIARALTRARHSPYWLMSLLFTLGFVVGFSAVLNAGILARQRSQVIALFLAMTIGARPVVEKAKNTKEQADNSRHREAVFK